MGYACIPFFWRQLGPPRLLFISPPKPSVTILPNLDSRFRKSQEPKWADDLVDQDSMKTLVSLAMV
jgi:hypothetical protein